LLQIRAPTGPSSSGGNDQCWYCPTCPYSCTLDRPHASKSRTISRRKLGGRGRGGKSTDNDILGGAAAWENVDRTAANCPSCHHTEAYFMQIQIRSADEPMSVFYKCCRCSHQWNDR
jgi:DNA-directed RNA polymerase III subunit RPC11